MKRAKQGGRPISLQTHEYSWRVRVNDVSKIENKKSLWMKLAWNYQFFW